MLVSSLTQILLVSSFQSARLFLLYWVLWVLAAGDQVFLVIRRIFLSEYHVDLIVHLFTNV